MKVVLNEKEVLMCCSDKYNVLNYCTVIYGNIEVLINIITSQIQIQIILHLLIAESDFFSSRFSMKFSFEHEDE